MAKQFETLTRHELEELARRFQGKAALCVIHPNYLGYNKKFYDFVTRGAHRKQLTIIFEESHGMQELISSLHARGVKETDPIFIVETKHDSAEPLKGWRKITARLVLAGAKKLELDGRILAFEDKQRMRTALAENRIPAETKEQIRTWRSYYRAITRTAQGLRDNQARIGCVGDAWARFKRSGQFQSVRIGRRFK